MGTNFYLEAQPPCECCGRPYERKHIGKSSAGWCFSLHVYPDEGIATLDDWKRTWAGKRIVSEYGEDVSEAEMLYCITERSFDRKPKPGAPYRDWADFYARNQAVPGPQGLARSGIIGGYYGCIGHGEGTWDYIVGEFS